MKLREEISENADALCEQFGISKLYLFGSVARGEDSPESDIDFLAEFDSPTPETMPERFFGFINAASEKFDRPVQLLTRRMIRNPHLKNSIDRDLLIIHE